MEFLSSLPLEVDLFVRLLASALAGAILGFERGVSQRPAGLRTHALVAVGAAGFALAGAYGFSDLGGTSDPARVAAQVVSGLGFIGAGAIIRNGGEVSGLTTAATVWAAGALGLLFASGEFILGIAALVVFVIILVALRPLKDVSSRVGRQSVNIVFHYLIGHGTLGPTVEALEAAGLRVTGVSVDDRELPLDEAPDELEAAQLPSGSGERRIRRLSIDGILDKSETKELAAALAVLKQRPEMVSIQMASA